MRVQTMACAMIRPDSRGRMAPARRTAIALLVVLCALAYIGGVTHLCHAPFVRLPVRRAMIQADTTTPIRTGDFDDDNGQHELAHCGHQARVLWLRHYSD